MTDLQFDLPKEQASIIKVIGVGGGGSNAVNHMFEQGIIGVNFVVSNTDSQALDHSPVPNKIQLGPKLTQGLGAGSNPECGMQSTEESIEEIKAILSKNTKMVFVTAGMGGGTGTGGAPVVARIAREMGILTVAIVTTPFSFEGKRKYNQALEGIAKLKEHVDTILVISNDKIREMYGNARQSDAFNHANNILTMAAKSISEIITVPGYINVDFADVKYVMMNGGAAIMGAAAAEGEGRALKAVQGALNSPLLNDNDIRGSKRILVNISSGPDEQVTIDEITEINEYIQEVAKDTDIIFGTCDDPDMGSKLSVTIIATGFEATYKPVFLTPVNKIVRDLNEDVKEKQTDTLPQPELKQPLIKETTQLNLMDPDEETPVQKETKTGPVIASAPATPQKVTLNVDEEEPYSLFSILGKSKEDAPSDNELVYEFETKQELPEEITEEVASTHVAETEAIEEKINTPEPEATLTGEEKEEDSFVVFNVKSYEANTIGPDSSVDLDLQRKDRKRMLSQLSYRSLNKSNLNELETTPAYQRKGVEVQNTLHSNASEISRYTIGEDTINQRPEVKKNNSFLHDRPD
jgi:cell division protein FtsZ